MLDSIVAAVRRDLAVRSRDDWRRQIEQQLRDRNGHPTPSFCAALSSPGEQFIFEIKRTSPSSAGTKVDLDPAELARRYWSEGAAAVSVLTEPTHFAGSLDDLRQVAERIPLPILRKDFIVDELQILEAKAAGAAAVLLIVAVLAQKALANLLVAARACGLDALVEVHTPRELKIALDIGAEIIGVNNRNLQSLAIDLTVGERLLPLIPAGVVRVAESGINNRADVDRLRAAGAHAFLIGTAVTRAADVSAKIRELRGL